MFRPVDRAKLRFAALLILSAVGAAHAQSFPTHLVRIIVPFAPGGLNDTAARLIQPYLEKALGQTVVVENRAGATGIVGAELVAKAAPDGHTLLMVASSYTVLPATTAVLPYNSERDLMPIALMGKNPLLFLVNAGVKAKTLGEFVALAKADPGKLNYGTPGAASQTRFVAELWSGRAGITMQHIPYRGGAPAVQSLIAGQTDFSALSPLVSLPQIQAGSLRALAVTSLVRYPQLPDVPTVAESGFPGFEAIQWVGLLDHRRHPEGGRRPPQCGGEQGAQEPGFDCQAGAGGHAAGRRHFCRIRELDRHGDQELDANSPRRRHQAGVIFPIEWRSCDMRGRRGSG